jgi:Concanavalin A-like lectin/glucanases superfamily
MKSVKYLSGLLPVITILFFTQTNFTSCVKETEIIRDTLIIKDTLTIKDTVTIKDTLSCYNLEDSLVAYYNFNGGNLNDSSGNNNHIIFNNAVKTTDRFGRANNAFLFDGASSFMRVANSASLNPSKAISLVAIVKIHDFYRGNCTGNQVFGKGTNDFIDGFYALRFRSTVGCNMVADTSKEVFYGNYGDASSRQVAQNLTHYIHANIWYTVVYTYENGQSKLYVNGKLVKTETGVAAFTPNSHQLFIGRHDDTQFPYWFKGVIDDVRIYKKALCQGAVNELSILKK